MTTLAILGEIRYRRKDPADMDLSPEAATSQKPSGFCFSKQDAVYVVALTLPLSILY
jgi:hypothetical protein